MNAFNISVLLAVAFSATSSFAAEQKNKIDINDINLDFYGRMVAGLEYTNNLSKNGRLGDRTRLAANQWGTSYLGVNATLPIDSDWFAIGKAEIGYSSANGETNDEDILFDRAAFVGASNKNYGEITAGNHLSITEDISDMDPMGFQSIGVNTLVNGRNSGVRSNSILYRSPSVYGFNLGYMHSFGGVVDDNKRASGDGISLSFENSGLKLRAIYDTYSDSFGRYTGGNNYGLGSQGAWTFSKMLGLGAKYTYGPATFFTGYNQVEAPDASYQTRAVYDDKAEQIWFGVNYVVVPQLTLLAGGYQVQLNNSDKKANLYSLGVNYEWSKNVILYVTGGYVTNNTISPAALADSGPSNHALDFNDIACESESSCDGASQLGGYTGMAIMF